MFTLESSHAASLVIALSFAGVVHFALLGFAHSLLQFFISFALFPFLLMGLTLFVPQDTLQLMSYLLVAAGLALSLSKLPRRTLTVATAWKSMEKKEKWIVAGTVLYLFAFFMNATIFKGQGSIQDALVYHLEGPKEWALYLNGAKFNANNPIAFTTSYYDYYYYFLFLLAKPLFVYSATQASTHYEFLSYTMLLSAQIFTGVLALVYVPLLILRFSSSLGLYKYLSLFFIYGLRLITWSWVLPKNDAFSFLCFLLSAELFVNHYVLKKGEKRTSFLFIAALILGIGTASKLTNAYVVIFSLIFFAAFYFKEASFYVGRIGLPKAVTLVALGLILGASAFLVRNAFYTGNPFYPIAKFGFPNIYLSDYADRPELYSDPGNWQQALVKIEHHLWRQPQLLLLLGLALFTRHRFFALFYVVMVTYMAKQTGPMFTYRMTTIFLVLALILFVLTLGSENFFRRFKNPKLYAGFFVAVILAFSKIQVEKIVKYPREFYLKSAYETARLNMDHWDFIVQNNLANRENKQYVLASKLEVFPYFSRYPIISLYDSVPEHRYDYYKK